MVLQGGDDELRQARRVATTYDRDATTERRCCDDGATVATVSCGEGGELRPEARAVAEEDRDGGRVTVLRVGSTGARANRFGEETIGRLIQRPGLMQYNGTGGHRPRLASVDRRLELPFHFPPSPLLHLPMCYHETTT